MIRYTEGDIKQLIPIMRDTSNPSGRKPWHFSISNLIEENNYSLRSFLTTEETTFVYSTRFKDVPKFINDPGLSIFARWRLRIGK